MTGIAAKPDDMWALPLLHAHHMNQHSSRHGELGWWESKGVDDPFALCLDYYARYQLEKEQTQ